MLTKENLPNLHALKMNANQRIIIYDLYNSTTTNFGGLFQETSSSREFPRRLLEWDKLDTLILSVNYLQGRIPDMKDYTTYTQADINAADSLPQALVGIPKVLPNIKRFSINLNRLTGELPEWLLRHPALDWWDPFTLVFFQEGQGQGGQDGRIHQRADQPERLLRILRGKEVSRSQPERVAIGLFNA